MNILPILIIAIFVFVPFSLFSNQEYVFICILLIISYLSIYKKKGWSILILSILYCLPYSGGLSENGLKQLSDVMWLPYNIIRILILIVFFQYYFFFKNKK